MSKLAAIPQERVESKGQEGVVDNSQPFTVEVAIKGVQPYLYHRYDVEGVEAKARAKKGSKEKKTDNLESMVYRDEDGDLVIPGFQLKAAICAAARYRQDPRSPRKSARDLMKAAIRIPGFAKVGRKTWDTVDKRPVVVQMNRVARSRPCLDAGWQVTFHIEVLLPQYVDDQFLNDLLVSAGQTCGLGDYRPDFGTFMITKFKRI